MKTDKSAVKESAAKSQKGKAVSVSCCAPINNQSVCCTPSKTSGDNEGACCAQPSDGSACCVKQNVSD